jgi:hypothetical protein
MTLADEAKFEGNLGQRSGGFLEEQARSLNSTPHYKAVRTAAHRLPEVPGELMGSHPELIGERFDTNSEGHPIVDCIHGLAQLLG